MLRPPAIPPEVVASVCQAELPGEHGHRLQKEFADSVSKLMQRFSDVPTVGMESILLNEDVPMVIAYLRRAKTVRKLQATTEDENKLAWTQLHRDHFAAHGKQWEGTAIKIPEDVMDADPGTRELTPREADILLVHQVTYPEKTCRMINVTQGIERCRPFMDYFECTTPGQRVWLTHRARFLTGLEALRCQGICYGERGGDGIARNFPDRLLADLAGNAFHSGSCLACVLALLVTLAMGEEHACLARAVSAGEKPSDSAGAEGTASGSLAHLDAIWGL